MQKQFRSKQRIADHGEVFTAIREVRAMCDLVNDYAVRSDSTFLEPACGTGNFLEEILSRKLNNLPTQPDGSPLLCDALSAAASLYGIELLSDNAEDCRNRLVRLWSDLTGFCDDRSVSYVRDIFSRNIICGNTLSLHTADSSGNDTPLPITFCQWDTSACPPAVTGSFLLSDLIAQGDNAQFRFNVIISNPPYQISDGGAQASALPLYNLFIDQAKSLSPDLITMIVPARWYAAGKGLDKFRKNMLSDDRISMLFDFCNASDCFPGVDIKGGVCYFLWDKTYHGDCTVTSCVGNKHTSVMKRPLLEPDCNIFIRQNEAVAILNKVRSFGEIPFSHFAMPAMTFGMRTYFRSFVSDSPGPGLVKLYANHSTGYIRRDSVRRGSEFIDQWKVIVPEAVGSGNTATDVLKPIISEPGSVNTETYIMNGPWKNKQEAENVCAYIGTRFFHFLLGIRKITQHTTAKVYGFVPVQDFSVKWTDDMLFKKYHLSDDEIRFINESVWNNS